MQVLLQIEKSKLQLQIRQQLKQESNLHPFYRSIILYTIKYKKVWLVVVAVGNISATINLWTNSIGNP